MRWIEATFKTASGEMDDVTERLTELGADGFIIEDEADFNRFLEENRQYWDYVDEALARQYQGVSRVKLYVSEDEDGRAQLARYTLALGRECETRTVDDSDWENNWRAYYKPLPIGEKLLILPQWEPIPTEGARRVLRLDPGLTFGTGNHATTRMCLEELEQYAAPEKLALDLGCGSGILGIGALVLGCGYVAGCDIDPKSPDVARENAALNGVSGKFLLTDMFSDISEGYDLICVNPPYIPTSELASLQAEVKREPVLALDGGADGLDFYRSIARDYATHLSPGGHMLLEVGIGQAEGVGAMFRRPRIVKDVCGVDRVVVVGAA